MDFNTNESLIEYLNINIREDDALDKIFKIIIEYLSTFKDYDFEYDKIIPFNGIMAKYINCANYLGANTVELRQAVDDFLSFSDDKSKFIKERILKETNKRTLFEFLFSPTPSQDKRIVQLRNNEKKGKENIFNNLYNQAILVYNAIKDFSKNNDELELEGFYNPNISNKNAAIRLINDAIQLVERDSIISERTKKSIIDYLNKALNEFDKPNTNWSLIFGKLRETIFVLGALGSLAGGITGTVLLNDAKEKLEEASKVIEKSSININYTNVEELFKINNEILIQYEQPKLLMDSSNKVNINNKLDNSTDKQVEE